MVSRLPKKRSFPSNVLKNHCISTLSRSPPACRSKEGRWAHFETVILTAQEANALHISVARCACMWYITCQYTHGPCVLLATPLESVLAAPASITPL